MAFNTVIISGRLTADPELRYTEKGTPVCDFTIVNNGINKNDVTFVDATAWSGTAEVVCKHFKKGSGIGVEGRLSNAGWTDKNTNKRITKLKVTARSVHFPLRSKSSNSEQHQNETNNFEQENQYSSNNFGDATDNDIPF